MNVDGEIKKIPGMISFSSSLNPIIDDVIPKTVPVVGGVLLTIKGSKFGNVDIPPDVFVGENICDVVDHNDTLITCTTPENDVGKHVVQVYVKDVGGVEPITWLTYQLSSESSDIIEGSLLGGTLIKVTGTGFGTDINNVKVSVGDYGCNVTDVKETEVECQTEPASSVVAIDNSGFSIGKKNKETF